MLVIMLAPVVLAAALVLIRGTGARAVLALRLRGRWLVFAAAAVQAVRLADPPWAARVLAPQRGLWPVLVIWTLAIVFAVVNAPVLPRPARPPLVVFVAGLTLNCLTVAVNGGMPFSPKAARMAGFDAAYLATPVTGHPPLGRDSRLTAFADVIPVPVLERVVSIGDLLLIGGLAGLLVAVMVTGLPSPPPPRPQHE
jgi:hypothetical protein